MAIWNPMAPTPKEAQAVSAACGKAADGWARPSAASRLTVAPWQPTALAPIRAFVSAATSNHGDFIGFDV